MRQLYRKLWLVVLGILAITGATAQLNTGGIPESYSRAIPPEDANLVVVAAPDVEALNRDDRANPIPYRFAVNVPVNIGVDDLRKGNVQNGATDVWRLTIHAPGALSLTLYFDQFKLPPNARLFLYNPQRTQLLGAFTELNNNTMSTFATSLIRGDKLTIEYNAPAGSALPLFHISEIAWAYRGVNQGDGINTGFGASGACEVNVNCSEGENWQRNKRGVTRIQIKRGLATLFCTGSLVNNTKNDGKPYVLTADHCGRLSSDADLSQWIFYFKYEGKICDDPAKEPYLSSTTGASMVAHGGEGGTNGSDFYLVLLDKAIPDSFNVYYNGWSRETTPSQSGVAIHHPQGDIKKISTYTKPLQPTYWAGDAKLAHWRVTWSQTENGHATTEFGSSGCPLFDSKGCIVGTLTGGDSSCDSSALELPDYYGMFSYHWDQNGTDNSQQLRPWLDPLNLNVMTLNGWALSTQDKTLETSVDVYPNPATNILNIRISGAENHDFRMKITDIFGNLVKEQPLNQSGRSTTIDIQDIMPGLFFLEIGDKNSRIIRKIMKY